MSDKRRRRWVAHDVYFLDGPLGEAVYDRFGGTGVALWFGFIAAAKKHHIEGRITYTSAAEALVLFGLPGMELVDHDGRLYTLDDFWRLLGDHKVTRRTSRGRATQVLCTRWARWQDPKATRSTGQRPRRSGQETTDTSRRDAPERDQEVPPDLDLDLDPDPDPDSPPTPRDDPAPPDAPATDEGGGTDDPPPPSTPLVDDLLRRLPGAVSRHVTRAQRRDLEPDVGAAIDAGWTTSRLVVAIVRLDAELGPLDGLQSPAATASAIAARIARVGDPPQRRSEPRDRCDRCDGHGVVLDDDGYAGACPTCRPDGLPDTNPQIRQADPDPIDRLLEEHTRG